MIGKRLILGISILLICISTAHADNLLKMESWRWVNEPSINVVKIEGVVINNSVKTYSTIQIFITAKDTNDNFLGVANSYLEPTPMLPGDTCIFTAYVDHATCPSRSLNITYRFDAR